MPSNYYLNLFLIILAIINLSSFLIMLVDKIKSARPGAERISEGQLFFMATIGGAVGVYVGMFVCHHKTRKWYFMIGIPLLILQNFALVYLIYLEIAAR
jgi:uncharacterized membrane protein YsdA (DUF1294 family)